MRKRVSGLGGTLRIASSRGRGTSLRLTFPVSRDSAIRPARKGTRGRPAPGRVVRR
jgi:hypothetical protein